MSRTGSCGGRGTGAAIQAASLEGQMDEVLLLDVTPLSIGVEVGGGVAHRLIPRNSTIPCSSTEIFTTSLDNQPYVPVHILQGEREMAVDNRSLTRFELAPIPPAPRGVPQIEVKFEIDADGIVHVAARDLGTGREQKVRVVASSGLNADQVNQLVADADKFKQSDAKRKELAEVRNTAASLLYSSERAVQECAGLVDAALISAVQADVEALKATLDGGDTISIRESLQALELSAYKVAESLYGTA